MNYQLKKPIRTYGRKKFKEVVIPLQKVDFQTLDNNNKSRISLFKTLNQIEEKESDKSMYKDPFETTFDRLLNNMRVIPKAPKTSNDTILLNSSDNRLEINDHKSFSHEFSFSIPISKQKARKKLKVQVTKKSIVKNTPIPQNNRKFKVPKDNSLKKYKLRNRKNGSKIISNILDIDFLSSNSEDKVAEERSYNQVKKEALNKMHYRNKKKTNSKVPNTISSNNVETKQCFVRLDNSSVQKWNSQLNTEKNNLSKETDQLSDHCKMIKNSTLKHNETSMEHCFVELEKLEMDSYVKSFSFGRKCGNVFNSTPIGRSAKFTNSIHLSPIPIRRFEELSNSAICTNNISVKQSNEICSEFKQMIEKCELEEKSKLLFNYSVNTPSISKCNLSQLEDANKENIDTSSIDGCNNNNDYDKEKLLAVQNSIQNIPENGTKQNGVLFKSVLTEDNIIVNAKKKKQLRFSVDENRSSSLFDDTNESIQTSLHNLIRVNNTERLSMSNLMVNEKNVLTSNKIYPNFTNLSKYSILNKNNNKEATLNEVQEKLPESLIPSILITSDASSDQVDLKLKSEAKADESKDMVHVVNQNLSNKNEISSEENSFIATCKKYSMPSCNVTLKQLQDPIKITRRRKYTQWDFDLDVISEDCNNSTALKEGQARSEEVSKDGRTMLQKDLPPLENTMEKSINNVSIALENPVYLKPGKSWARSLSILNNIQTQLNLDKLSIGKGKGWKSSVQDILDMQNQGIIQSCIKKNDSDNELQVNNEIISKSEHDLVNDKSRTCDSINLGRVSRRISVRVVPIQKTVKSIEDAPFLEVYGIVPIKSQRFTLLNNPRKSSICNIQSDEVDNKIIKEHGVSTAREVILQRCLQKDYVPFSTCFTDSYLEHCRKIGEGVYGEVFLYQDENKQSVIKVIPIEGSELVNGEPQKKFHEILSEIVIAMELHNLRFNTKYTTDGFVEVKNIKCIKGRYPEKLIELWNIYDEEKRSDNDCPSMFCDDQLYIVLELGHGGQDLEAFVFNTAEEAHILFIQAALSLAVAEKAVQFEHRDLHWGNILISPTSDSCMHYKLGQKNIELISKGVKVSIIDFTLSRITYQGCSVFNDLASDPALFTAQGEYQFEIYRLMRDKVINNWQKFEPYTNVLWLHYTLDKMITAVRYRKRNLKIHKNGITKLKELKNEILTYESAYDFVMNCDKVVNLLRVSSKSEMVSV